MRNDKLLVTTQGVRGGKQHHNLQGMARLSVSKGFNEKTDEIVIDSYTGSAGDYHPRETALVNITFQDGKFWSGSFRELQTLICKG